MTEKPWLAFVESNTSGTGRLFVERTLRLGIRPMLIARTPDRYPFAHMEGLTFVCRDTGDLHSVIATCQELNADGRLAGVWSSSEYFIETAARAARACGTPGPDPDAVATCRDKLSQRRTLRDAGVPQPWYRCIQDLDEALAVMSGSKWPVIVKPRTGSGSVGVMLCDNMLTLRTHLEEILVPNARDPETGASAGYLIEEFVRGKEFSVEVFDGTAVIAIRKYLGPLPHFVETGHDAPADVNGATRNVLVEAAEQAIEALGLRWGPAHVEVRLARDGPRIIEVNPRLAGGMIPELVRHATCVDLIEATIQHAAGMPIPAAHSACRHASIRFFLRNQKSLDIGRLAGRQHIAEVSLYESLKHTEKVHGDFRDRIGHLITVADSAKCARRAATRAVHAATEY